MSNIIYTISVKLYYQPFFQPLNSKHNYYSKHTIENIAAGCVSERSILIEDVQSLQVLNIICSNLHLPLEQST